MSWNDGVKSIIGFLTGEALIGAMSEIKDTVDQTTRKVIKASVLYIMFVIGMLFVLIGIANYLQAHFLWVEGIGFIVVGLVIVLLGFFAKMMR